MNNKEPMNLGTYGTRIRTLTIAAASLAALCIQCACGTARAEEAKKPYYTEPPLYGFRPNPDQEEIVFGDVGVSGLLINFYKGVVATVDKTLPGTPADGKFKPGQIITGINGVAFEGKNPYVILGTALTKAEATDGVLVFDVKDNAQAPVKKVKVVIPVLGSYGDTWPLNSEKSKRIVSAAAKFYSTDKAFKKEFLESDPSDDDGPIGAALACLFLLSTGDDQYLPCVKEYFHRFIPAVTNIGTHTWNNGYNGIACAEYYLRTGDAEVLPVIQYYCDDAATRQYYGCAWGHWGSTPTPSYTSGGTMNAAGTQMLTVMLLGKECGVNVNDAALQGALRYVYRFAGHGGVPYGNHRMENWLGANGKNGMIAAAMQIAAATQGDPTIYQLARNCLGMVMLTSYPNLICGHGDEGRSDGIWRSITSPYVRDVKPALYHSIMGSLAWYYDLCRRPSGAFGMSGNLEFHDVGSGAGIALAYTAPLKTLRITGASPSKYSKKFTVPAWLWGSSADLAFLSIEKNPKFASYGKPDLIEIPTYALPTVSATNQNAMPKNEILKNVYHESYVIRANAAIALKRIGAFADLENLLDDPDPRVRRAALDGMVNCFWAWIGFCGPDYIQQKDVSTRMIASLKRMLSDTNEAVYVVDGALAAMSLAPPAAINDCVPLIMPWLKHDDWWLREAAFMALFALRTDPANFEKVLPALVETMTKEYQPMPRDLFVDSLQPLLTDKAGPVGKELLAGMLKAVETTEVKPDIGPYRRSREGTYNVSITAQACLRRAPETALQVAQSLRMRLSSLDAGYIMGLADNLLATTNSLKPAERDDLLSILYTDFRKELMKRLKTDTSVLDKVIDLLHLTHPDVAWHVLGTPLPADRTWRFMSFNPQEKDVLHLREKKRFRDVTLPAGTENWFAPEFNDTAWKAGKAPIGMGVNVDSRRQIVTNRSDWGAGEFLLMRTTFSLDTPTHDYIRLRVMTRQGCHVYLNGHKVHTYEWWSGTEYSSILLGPTEANYLKKGVNTLAVYSNLDHEKGQTRGLTDVYVEALDMKDLTKYDTCPPSGDQQKIYPPSAMPRVDAHTHMDATDQYARSVAAMDGWGGTITISLPGLFWVKANDGRNAGPESVKKIPGNDMVYVKEKLNDRILFAPGAFITRDFMRIWWSVEEIAKFKKQGFVGLKLWPHGIIVSSKIPQIDEHLDEAGRQGMPIIGYHGGNQNKTDRSKDDAENPEDDAIEMFGRHPQTTVIFAHGLFMLTSDAGLKQLAGIFDKYPNVFVDLAIGQQRTNYTPSKARAFYIKYHDRILYGTDVFAADRGAAGFMEDRKLLETDQLTSGHAELKGLHLPDEVLNHIYYWNAARLIPRVKEVLQARHFKIGYELGTFKFDRLPPDVTVNTLVVKGKPADLTGTLASVTESLKVEIGGKTYDGIDNRDGTWKLPGNKLASLPQGSYDVKVTARNSIGLVRTDSSSNELIVTSTSEEL